MAKAAEKTTRIEPTVGRIVWFRPQQWDHPDHADKGAYDKDQPFAAQIAHVWPDGTVNLAITHPNGSAFRQEAVPLVGDGDDKPEGDYCEWMPYQKGQAAKTDAAEKKAADGDDKSG